MTADEELEFVGRLCLALGRTLSEVSEMGAAEFVFWREYAARHGFPADRIEAAVCVAGAAVCRALGEKVEPRDLVPRFEPAASASNAVLAARLSALRGAKVVYVPNAKA